MKWWYPSAGLLCSLAAAQTLTSLHPVAGQAGTAFTVTVRATNLSDATTVLAPGAPFRAVIEGIKSEPSTNKNRPATDIVTLRITATADAAAKGYPIRLISPTKGVSNTLPLRITSQPVTAEPDGPHETPEQAIALPPGASLFAGKLSRRGEADLYSFRAEAGQTMTFELLSGFPQVAAGGSAATISNFDPSLALYEAGTSWLDPSRLKRIAYNDEPVWVFGKPTDAHLVHRFEKAGTYFLRVEAFAGQGGSDYSYTLRAAPGTEAPKETAASGGWDERSYSRRLDSNRMNQLARRGGTPATFSAIETYRSEFKLPALLEGALAQPGELHRAKFRVDSPTDIAIEIETPNAAPPFFNPIVRLLDPSGEEAATNVFAGKGACTGALTKSLQAKTIVPLRNTGEYTIEVRDAASDLNTPEFRYRIQVRPQVPHLGRVRIDADAINLKPGEAKSVAVSFDREEDYRGAISISAEDLPPGVSATTGADYEPDTDPPPATGKRERYVPRTERAVVILAAAADAAPLATPHTIRLIARPLVDGKLGEPLLTKSILTMVVAKQQP